MAKASSFPDFFGSAVMNISFLNELSYVREEAGKIKIGALTTHTALKNNKILLSKAHILAKAASFIGSPQIRNRGTIGGNIINASPVGDLLPSLYVLNAVLKLQSSDGERFVPIQDFIVKPSKTIIDSRELLTEISIDALEDGEKADFLRSATRKALAITKASAAFRGTFENGRFKNVSVALGSVGPVIMKAVHTEKFIESSGFSDGFSDKLKEALSQDCSPITDLRSTKEYRAYILSVLIERMILSFLD